MTLIVPEYVLRQREAKKKADEAAKELSLKDRVPKPTGWRILVMPYMGKEKTEGGIHVPDSVREKVARATVVAYVVKMGPLAYKDVDKFGTDGDWCKEGDWIVFRAFTGTRLKIHGKEFRIINDDNVEAVVEDPRGIERV